MNSSALVSSVHVGLTACESFTSDILSSPSHVPCRSDFLHRSSPSSACFGSTGNYWCARSDQSASIICCFNGQRCVSYVCGSYESIPNYTILSIFVWASWCVLRSSPTSSRCGCTPANSSSITTSTPSTTTTISATILSRSGCGLSRYLIPNGDHRSWKFRHMVRRRNRTPEEAGRRQEQLGGN